MTTLLFLSVGCRVISPLNENSPNEELLNRELKVHCFLKMLNLKGELLKSIKLFSICLILTLGVDICYLSQPNTNLGAVVNLFFLIAIHLFSLVTQIVISKLRNTLETLTEIVNGRQLDLIREWTTDFNQILAILKQVNCGYKIVMKIVIAIPVLVAINSAYFGFHQLSVAVGVLLIELFGLRISV